MNFQLPQRRQLNPIQVERRKIPVEQIIETMGNNPLAQGIAETGKVIGDALNQRAANIKKGKQLATLEHLAGQQAGSYAGLDPETAATLTGSYVKNSFDAKKEGREQAEKIIKVRALENQFGYKTNELGDDYDAAKIKVQSDLMEKRAEAARSAAAETAAGKSDEETYTIAGSDEKGNIIQIGNKSGTLRTIPVPSGSPLRPKNEAPPTPEAAGRLAMLQGASSDLDALDGMIFDKNGSLNRTLIAEASVPGGGLPFTKGRDVNSLIQNAVAAKLRAETGAAATESEVKNISNRFKPTLSDNSDTARSKLARLKEFMTTAISASDPRGNKLKPLAVPAKKVGRFTVETE